MSNQVSVSNTSAAFATQTENALVRARIAKAVLAAVMEEYVESPQDVACHVFLASREALGEALNFLYTQADNTEEEICALFNTHPDSEVGGDLPEVPELPTLEDDDEWTE